MNKKCTAVMVLFAIGASTVAASAADTVCLATREIDSSTPTPDTKAIVFHMKNGDVWQSTLKGSCPDLKFEGYVWQMEGTDQVCSDQQALHVINSGQSCVLGQFEKISKAP